MHERDGTKLSAEKRKQATFARSMVVAIFMAIMVVIGFTNGAQAQLLNNGQWETYTSNIDISNRTGNAAVVYKDQLWVIGGFSSSGGVREVLVTSDGANWARTSDPDWEGRGNIAAVVFNGAVYIIGGRLSNGGPQTFRFTDEIWRATSPGDWQPVAVNMVSGSKWSPRNFMRAAVLNGKLYIMGGSNNNLTGDNPSGYNDVYSSPDGVNWTKERNATWTPRATMGCCTINGRIYIAGGEGGSNFSDSWSWDGISSSWTQEAPLPSPDGRGAGVNGLELVANFGKIWAIAGRRDSGTQSIVLENRLGNNSWAVVTPENPRRFNARFQFGAVLWSRGNENRIWLTPGQNESGNRVDDVTSVLIEDDGTPPVITLLGEDNIILECGAPFDDPGATAVDAFDGSVAVITTGSVNIQQSGTYSLTYSATDSAGNISQKSRLVLVSDTLAPTLTLQGNASVQVSVRSSYTDAGATANDQCDGNLSGSIQVQGNVDVNRPGTYTLTYNVQDNDGRSALPVSRTVTVIDNEFPVITLTPPLNNIVECGTTFVDPGATAVDGQDGNLTNAIQSSGNVTSGVPGSYELTYTVSDSAGNVTTARRSISVVDTTRPSLQLNGASTASLFVNQIYRELGANAVDGCSGILNDEIVISGTVDTSRYGSYTVTYTVSDDSGNTSESTRTVNVIDNVKPVVLLLGSQLVTVECGGAFIDPLASATDEQDGDISNTVTVAGTVDTSSPGEYMITYSAQDASGNAATAQRTVTVADTTLPTITLRGVASLSINTGDQYTDAGATARDSCGDADLTSAIRVGNPLASNTNKAGLYSITYDVMDAAGNEALRVTRSVTVRDIGDPVITLVEPASPVVERCAVFIDPGVTANDDQDGDITNRVTKTGTVDTRTVGTYTVTYRVSDSAGNSTELSRSVTVRDTQKPLISLNGQATVSIEAGTSYLDAGATASDDCTGDISGRIVTTNAVNSARPGQYFVSYDVTDTAGNAANTVRRTVNVVDATPPVLNLIGATSTFLECGTVYTDQGATARDSVEGDLSGEIVTSSNFDTNTPGSYTVNYRVCDSSQNCVTAQRAVIVRDSKAPVVTLRGSVNVEIVRGSAYTDAGATATDSCEGVLNASLEVENNVQVNVPGIYSVTYSVTDGAGNKGSASRSVQVFDDPCVSPPAPVNVQASDGNLADRVRVTWTFSSSADRFEVYRNTVNSFVGAILLGESVENSFDDPSALAPVAESDLLSVLGCRAPQTTPVPYFYFVKAFERDCESVVSASDSGYRGGGGSPLKTLLQWLGALAEPMKGRLSSNVGHAPEGQIQTSAKDYQRADLGILTASLCALMVMGRVYGKRRNL